MYKPVGWEDVARSPPRRRSAEKPARDVPAAETAASRESSEAEESTEGQEAEESQLQPETKETTGVNAVRLLSDMLSRPANRICAECRTHLADTSRIYASFSTVDAEDAHMQQQRGSTADAGTDVTVCKTSDSNGRARDMSLSFRGNHELFAPPPNPNDDQKQRDGGAQIGAARPPPHGVCGDASVASVVGGAVGGLR